MTSTLILGDCIQEMKKLPEASVDAVITDSPYGLEFMGKDWDSFKNGKNIAGGTTGLGTPFGRKQALPAFYQRDLSEWHTFQRFNFQWAVEARRVLKPGGFLFAMGGTRTHHRLTCGIEDAGFLIRDEIEWAYASGFPKSRDLAGLISKREGAKREGAGSEGNTFPLKSEYQEYALTENAKKWDGWGTPALKPAHEPIIIAQKPCEGSITENVMKYEVGGYNIDAARIPLGGDEEVPRMNIPYIRKGDNNFGGGQDARQGEITGFESNGRFPPNLLVQDDVLNDGKISHGQQGAVKGDEPSFQKQGNVYGDYSGFGKASEPRGDDGSFSRYFSLDAWWAERIKHLPRDVQKVYPFLIVPKAAKGEKEEGLDELEQMAGFEITGRQEGAAGSAGRRGEGTNNGNWAGMTESKRANIHPTCKPISLMSYLITLATREKAVVLDPFMGSGTTGIAAHITSRDFIGIEISDEYFKIAKARIKEAEKQTRLVF